MMSTDKPKKPGRPRGSIDRVLRGRDLGLDHFVAVKAYLNGVDARKAIQAYLLSDDTPGSAESCLRTLADLMVLISDHGKARRQTPSDDKADQVNIACEALDAVAQAINSHLSQAYEERKLKKNIQIQAHKVEAAKRNLLFAPRNRLPSPPPHLANLRSFDDWYDDTYAPDDLPDQYELNALHQEHLSAWYESQGYYVPPDYSLAHHRLSEMAPTSATQIEETPRRAIIDSAVRAKAARLIDRLDWTVQRMPTASDHVKAWIAGSTLKSLVSSDVFTLYSLGQLVIRHGSNWWRQIPGLGPVRAARLQAWLVEVKVQGIGFSDSHFESIQIRRLQEVRNFYSSQNIPPALLELQLEPLAGFINDDQINGRNGLFRTNGPNMLKADTDIDAIVSALSKYKDKHETLTVYAREICRFCLWSYRIKKQPISSLSVSEAREYREFLNSIPSDWITPTRDAPPRGASDWRPFKGQLSESSQRKALTAINVVLSQLMESGYLTGNAMAGVLKTSGLGRPQMDVSRSFDDEQWALICEVLDALAPSPSSRRTRALVHCLQSMGLRRSELAAACVGDIQRMRVDGHTALLLKVLGKGNKERLVVLPPEVMDLISLHLKDREGLFVDDFQSDTGKNKIPLISVLREPLKAYKIVDAGNTSAYPGGSIVIEPRKLASVNGALCASAMAESLKRLLKQCSIHASKRGLDSEAFERASLHWLRHTFGHSMADAEVDLRTIQLAMGHRNINTTGHYSKADVKQMVRGLRQGRKQAMQLTHASSGNTVIGGNEPAHDPANTPIE